MLNVWWILLHSEYLMDLLRIIKKSSHTKQWMHAAAETADEFLLFTYLNTNTRFLLIVDVRHFFVAKLHSEGDRKRNRKNNQKKGSKWTKEKTERYDLCLFYFILRLFNVCFYADEKKGRRTKRKIDMMNARRKRFANVSNVNNRWHAKRTIRLNGIM